MPLTSSREPARRSTAGNVRDRRAGERIASDRVVRGIVADRPASLASSCCERATVVRDRGAATSRPTRCAWSDAGSRPPDFDPRCLAVDFSFKVECPASSTARRERVCPPEPRAEPEIDYLAKDYASFRRLMLDRLARPDAAVERAQPGRPRRRPGRAAGLRRRPPQLPAGRGRHRGVPGHRPPARLGAPPRAAGRLPHARRLQRPRLGAGPGRAPTS